MEGIHEILDALYSSSEGDVLATIIRVEGSAYRKEGTCMLFRSDGTQVGMLSAGCLETDLSCRVKETMVQRTTKTVVYDMREEDDLSWGQGTGCNGVIHVLLEPVDPFFLDQLCKLKFFLESGNQVTMIKRLSKDSTVTDYLFVANDQHFFGKWHGGISGEVKKLLSEVHQTLPKSGIRFSPELSANLYIQSFEPKPRLIVFGAGSDAVPLVKLASLAGFSVSVSDWRSSLCNEFHFPEADQLIVGFPSEVIPRLQLSNLDSILILTHHFQRDKELLNHFIGGKFRYVGILGPISRTQRLLDGKSIPPEIRSPVGLAIGAEGPEEIAVSIVAELIQYQRNKKLYKVVSS